jgi:antitoxin VapB
MKRQTAKVFKTGGSQAVLIPKPFRFTCDEVFIERDGERIILTTRPRSWKEYFARAARRRAAQPAHVADSPPDAMEPP